jgi:septum site-determining protein MinC
MPTPSAHGSTDSAEGRARSVLSELRFGQLGIAQLTLHSLDPAAVWAELDAKVKAAPQLFTAAPLVIDLGQLPLLPTEVQLRALIAAIGEAGMIAVGLVHGTPASDALARAMDLALFAKLRAAAETAERKAGPTPVAAAFSEKELSENEPSEKKSVIPTTASIAAATPQPSMRPAGVHHAQPVRSGQQVYARGSDLTLTAMVGNGAEVIADGSIHIYGTLRGRALAGAQGDTGARIFCQNFQAELISIAGQYRVFEDMPANLRGKSVQAWLEGDKLKIAVLA